MDFHVPRPSLAIILVFSVFAGMFFTPNQTAVMNSLPPDQRGAGAGMNATFMNSAQVLSIGVFFSIVTLGLASTLPQPSLPGARQPGRVRSEAARHVSQLPPIGSLFAAFLGFNPIQTEIPHQVLASLGPAHAAYLTGRSFFPKLISPAFANGLHWPSTLRPAPPSSPPSPPGYGAAATSTRSTRSPRRSAPACSRSASWPRRRSARASWPRTAPAFVGESEPAGGSPRLSRPSR